MSSPSKPFTLYTAGTPNGFQGSILLEELKAIYPAIEYNVQKIDIIGKQQQKEPWFIKLNPNGRIPTLVDHRRNNFVVFETAAILLYMVHNYDKDLKLWFDPTKNPNEYSELLQWIAFAHGGIGPMQGQSNHFKLAQEDIPYAKKRYVDETKRLYGVLNIRLTNRDYLVGPDKGIFTIADIKAFPWVRSHAFSGIETLDQWPNVKAWIARCAERPATRAGLLVGR